MTKVEMPKANENMTEATLDRWLVKEGHVVAANQSLCEIITDKAKFEMPSPVAGIVLRIFSPERAMLPVGFVMCVIGNPGEPVSPDVAIHNEAILASHRSAATTISSAAATTSAPGIAPPIGASGAIRATPAARRLAKEAGIDLAAIVTTLKLTAPVSEKDVKTFQEGQK